MPKRSIKSFLPEYLQATHVQLFLLMIILGMISLFLGFSGYWPGADRVEPFIFKELGSGLIVGGLVSLLVEYLVSGHQRHATESFSKFIETDVRNELANIRERIITEIGTVKGDVSTDLTGIKEYVIQEIKSVKAEVSEQLGKIVRASSSLEAMQSDGVSQFYMSRGHAVSDMVSDLESDGVSEILIMGISLNDIALQANGTQNAIWEAIKRYLDRKTPVSSASGNLSIRILIIHPDSFGAELRIKGEIRDDQRAAQILRGQVKSTVETLSKLTGTVKHNGTSVELSAKLYFTSPSVFLCRTDSVSYIHHYFFWGQRGDRFVPTLRCVDLPPRDDAAAEAIGSSLHEGMKKHFDWIWENASVALDQFGIDGQFGIERGMYESGALTVFTNSAASKARMISLMGSANKRLWIQGISLYSFFSDHALQKALLSVYERDAQRATDGERCDIRLLFLRPDSSNAALRSYREETPRDHDGKKKSYSAYLDEPEHLGGSTLARHTNRAMEDHFDWLKRTGRNPADSMRSHFSSTTCFMLMTEDAVLVEQYHYGKVTDAAGDQSIVLGKDMPVIEYRREPHSLYELNRARNPYLLLEDHFSTVWNDFTVVPTPVAGSPHPSQPSTPPPAATVARPTSVAGTRRPAPRQPAASPGTPQPGS